MYNYENFDEIVNNKDIDIVYVVFFNLMYVEYMIWVVKVGKYVICEKFMGLFVKECEVMIVVCDVNKVKLFIGYCLYFDFYYMEIIKI